MIKLKHTIFCLLASLGSVIAQDNYATLSFENRDTTGSDLLYFIYDELGRHRSGRAKKAPTKIPVKSYTYTTVFYSNGFEVMGLFYLKTGDSLKLVQEKGARIKLYGSKQSTYRLLELLHNNGLFTYEARKEKPLIMSLTKAITYTYTMLDKVEQVIDSFALNNPDADIEMIKMIKDDVRYYYLIGLFENYNQEGFSQERSDLIKPVIDQELAKLETMEPLYQYSISLISFKATLGEALYLNHFKKPDRIPWITAKDYNSYLLDLFSFSASCPESIKEDLIFHQLTNLFLANLVGTTPINQLTDYFYAASKNERRIEYIKEWEELFRTQQDSKRLADYIIKEPELRETQLTALDGSITNFGELFDRLKGQGVYIDIWATWCAPCRVEMNKLSNDFFKEKKTRMVYISIDEDREKWETVANDQYLFDQQVEHYLLKPNNITIDRLLDGIMSIPKYSYINANQTEFRKNVLKPTQFNWK